MVTVSLVISLPERSLMIRVSEVVNPGAPVDGTQSEPDTRTVLGWVVDQRPLLMDSTEVVSTPMMRTVTFEASAEVLIMTGYGELLRN